MNNNIYSSVCLLLCWTLNT